MSAPARASRSTRLRSIHRIFKPHERARVVARIAKIIERRGLSVEAACGIAGINDKTLRNWYKDAPEFRERIYEVLETSLAKRRARAEKVVVDCMASEDRALALKAATFFLEAQCGWRRNPDVSVNIAQVEERTAIVHVDMSEIRARAKANEEVSSLVREVETAGSSNVG